MAAGLPLPKAVAANGWLLFEQSKMSKSRGNVVRTETILATLGADALRYFLMREVVFGQDGSFSFDALVQRYNADLANGYGNLTSRVLAMITQYFGGIVPAGDSDPRIVAAAEKAAQEFAQHFDALDFSRALESLWALVAAVDGYITEKAPWKLGAAEDAGHRASILYTCAEALPIITALVYPVLPDAGARIWAQLGLGDIAQADLKSVRWGQLAPGTKLGQSGPVFPRAEKDMVKRMQELETNNPGSEAKPEPTSEAAVMTSVPASPGAGGAANHCGSNRGRCRFARDRGHRLQGAGSIDAGSVSGGLYGNGGHQPAGDHHHRRLCQGGSAGGPGAGG